MSISQGDYGAPCSSRREVGAQHPPTDRRLSALAGAQHGLLTVAQPHEAGLEHSTISKRVARGVLHREHRGVYSLARPLSREGRLLAAVLAAGPGALLSHLAAAALHGLLRHPPYRIDLIAPRLRSLPPPVRVHVYRRIHPRRDHPERHPRHSVARTLVDLSEVLDVGELANVIYEAAFRSRFSLGATRDAMTRANGRHHLHVLKAALTAHRKGSAGTKSRAEREFKRMIEAAGLPRPDCNVHVEGIEVDLFWPGANLCAEVDGIGHGRAPTRREDELRDRLLRARGYAVLRFTDEEIERSPGAAIARLAASF